MRVVDFTVGVVDLVNVRFGWVGDVEDYQALVSSGDVGIGSSQVDTVSIMEFNRMDMLWMSKFGNIEYFYTFFITYKRIAELDGHRVRMVQQFVSHDRGDFGCGGLGQIDYD